MMSTYHFTLTLTPTPTPTPSPTQRDLRLIHHGEPADFYARNAGPDLDMDKTYARYPKPPAL